MKEKVRVYPEKGLIMIRGRGWSLQLKKVKVKAKGEVMFAFKPLEVRYDAERETFTYTQLKNPIWLNRKEFDQLITTLIQLTEGYS